MKNLPLSILLPVYNHAEWLSLAIESALAQSYSDFEIIIINDGSTDHTAEVIQHYARRDARVKPIHHAQNKGIAEALGSGLQSARGRYLAGLSATDCYRPGFLQKSMELLLHYPQIGLCCADAGLFVNDPTQYTPCRLIANATEPLLFHPAKIQRVFKYAHLSIPGATTVLKKDSFVKQGGYRRGLHFLCDGFLNHQVALSEGAIYIPEVLTLFRESGYAKISSQKPNIRQEALRNLKELLLQPKQSTLLQQMRKAALLGILCKERPLDCLKHPVLWTLYFDLAERYLYKRFRHLLRKPLVSADFLRAHRLEMPESVVPTTQMQ